jgi:hypothetical protein
MIDDDKQDADFELSCPSNKDTRALPACSLDSSDMRTSFQEEQEERPLWQRFEKLTRPELRADWVSAIEQKYCSKDSDEYRLTMLAETDPERKRVMKRVISNNKVYVNTWSCGRSAAEMKELVCLRKKDLFSYDRNDDVEARERWRNFVRTSEIVESSFQYPCRQSDDVESAVVEPAVSDYKLHKKVKRIKDVMRYHWSGFLCENEDLGEKQRTANDFLRQNRLRQQCDDDDGSITVGSLLGLDMQNTTKTPKKTKASAHSNQSSRQKSIRQPCRQFTLSQKAVAWDVLKEHFLEYGCDSVAVENTVFFKLPPSKKARSFWGSVRQKLAAHGEWKEVIEAYSSNPTMRKLSQLLQDWFHVDSLGRVLAFFAKGDRDTIVSNETLMRNIKKSLKI